MTSYTFRPVTMADLAMLQRWLATPEVARWWGDPIEQAALIAGDLGDPRMTQWIVSAGDTPFAYAQYYPVAAWPQPQFADCPPGSVAVDPFIGDPRFLGQRHGRGLLRALAERLLAAGATRVVIDPDADNVRARAAYRAAGFVGEHASESDDGTVIVMTFAA